MSSRKSIQHYYNPNNELVKTITNTEEGFNLTEITTTYYYDAFGRCIAKTSDTKVKTKFINDKHLKTVKYHLQKQKTQHKSIYYLWDGNRQAQEYTDTHVFTTVYEENSFEPVARLVWLRDELLKSANDEIKNTKRESWEPEPKLIPNMQVFHYHNDQLGTPNELTNQEGEVVWLADYQAWGNTAKVVWREEKLEQLQVSADELQPIRFQGQSFDEETGLHYNRFRYFDPDLGMFTTRDPIGLMGGSNVFQYAPNPTGWVDPFGLTGRTKPISLPSIYKVKVDIEHILDRHTACGLTAIARAKAGKDNDVFPQEMTEQQIEKAVKEAYSNVKILSSQGDRVLARGKSGSMVIEMWINKSTKIIETAYPK